MSNAIQVNVKSTAKIADKITLQPGSRGTGEILVDGEPFPYIVDDQPIKVEARPDGLHVAYLPVVTYSVEIGEYKPQSTTVNVYAAPNPDEVARAVRASLKGVA